SVLCSQHRPYLFPFPSRRSSDPLCIPAVFLVSILSASFWPAPLNKKDTFVQIIIEKLNVLSAVVWGPAMLFLLLFTGLFLMVYLDRRSTRLNSSHVKISYAVFCL